MKLTSGHARSYGRTKSGLTLTYLLSSWEILMQNFRSGTVKNIRPLKDANSALFLTTLA